MVINRLARAVVLMALAWSLGSLAAAVNWHGNWMTFVRLGDGDTDIALHAQERWQHWVDMTLVGVVVVVVALVAALWPLVRAAGDRARERAVAEHGRSDGFGGGSEELRRHADDHGAV